LALGSGKYVSVPANAILAPGTGDFTVSGWFKLSSFASRNAFWQFDASPGSSLSGELALFLEPDKTLLAWIHGVGGAATYTWSSVATDTWYNIVVTRSGTSFYMYINGVSVITPATNSTNFTQNGFDIGAVTTNSYMAGIADDIRVYNRSLSASEIKSLYETSILAKLGATQSTGSLSTGLVGHWTFDGKNTNWTSPTAGTVTDSSGGGNTGTLNGYSTNMTRATAPTDGPIGQALQFDGIDDNVFTSLNPSPTSPFSVGFWVKKFASDTTGYLVSGYAGGNTWAVYIDGSYRINLTKYVVDFRNSSGAITDTAWHHVAVSHDGTTVNFYIDGVLDNSTAYSTTFANSTGFNIGSTGGAGSNWW
jgi:hypothetical protein